jgi:UDP-N-acetylmuramoyl-tripeptide--D-alanyl-D-alanine ligase
MATEIPANEAEFTLGDVAAACGGTLEGATADTRVRGVCTDTRTIREGALFVALRGERTDGHEYLGVARARGAVACVVAQDAGPSEGPRVRVQDTLAALGALGRAALERARTSRSIPVLAVGGAAGKTTTKELAAAAVRALFGQTLATRGNLNNLIGVPMTVLGLTASDRAAVIEAGTNAPGEIARLGAILAPDVSLVLNVDNEHTEGLKSLEAVAEEEGALFAACRDSERSAVVGNLEEPYSLGQIERAHARARRLTFGEGRAADVRLCARASTGDGRSRITLRVGEALVEGGAVECEVSLGLLGPGPAIDAAAALCAALALLGAKASEAQVLAAARAMESVEPVAGRLVPRIHASGALVLDDTYNANPRSLRASVDAAAELAKDRGGALRVLLADMLELGDLGPALHREARELVEARGAASVCVVGPLCAEAFGADRSAATPEEAASRVAAVWSSRDVVLVKGSRGMKMERAVAALWASVAPAR